jgi:hypothetical protein
MKDFPMGRTGIKLLVLATLLVYTGYALAQTTPSPSSAEKSKESKKQAFRQLLEKQREKQKQAAPTAGGGQQTIENPLAMPAGAKAMMPADGKGLPGITPPAKGLPTPAANPRELTAEQRAELLQRQREAYAKMPRPTESQLHGIVESAKVVEKKRDPGSAGLPKVAPQAPREVSRAVDEQLAKELAPMLKAAAPADKTTPVSISSTKCDDATYLRRVYLDVIGRAPTPEELTAFSLDTSADKRAATVDRLLANSDYGQNWGRYWRDVVMYRKSDDRGAIAARPMQDYLAAEFNKNTPWDEIARKFIVAEGLVAENGNTAIFMAQMGEHEDVTSEMSRIFLGIQIQCAQCHDHPSDRWKREQFHELAAFFPRNSTRPESQDNQAAYIVMSVNTEPRFRLGGNNGRPRASNEHYMSDLKDPTARGTPMEPTFFVSGKQLPHGLTDLERRGAAALMFTGGDNPWFARAVVNRLWSELCGEGFYEPIDDIGPDRAATAPKTLDLLAAQFQANSYDLKWLMRTITQTDLYQRPSQSRRNPDQVPFQNNVAQRLRGDQLYSQLVSALGINEVSSAGAAMSRGPYGRDVRTQFNSVFGYDPSVRRDEVTASIPQALALMNGQSNYAIDGTRRGSVLETILRKNPDNGDAVQELYLRTLSREPSKNELQVSLAHIKSNASRSRAFEDLFWALLNSAEFHHRR